MTTWWPVIAGAAFWAAVAVFLWWTTRWPLRRLTGRVLAEPSPGPLLCMSCGIAHRPVPGDYARCGECGHVWRTVHEWMGDARRVYEQAREHDLKPLLSPQQHVETYTCPRCAHDISYASEEHTNLVVDAELRRVRRGEPQPQDPPW